MKNECCLIRDLLPLYAEDMVSEYTRSMVEEHLQNCEECQKELEYLKKPLREDTDVNILPMRVLRKRLREKKFQTIAMTVAVILAIVVTAFSWLTKPEYLPYSQDLITVTEADDGTITLSFSETVTNYYMETTRSSFYGEGARGTDATVYTLEAWTTRLDSLQDRAGVRDIVITPKSEEGLAIYYEPCGDGTNVLLYSLRFVPAESSAASLPRLALSYYVTLAGIAALLLLALLMIFWSREKVRIWLIRILFLPVSYLLADLCIMGFNHTTYTMIRNFRLILLTALPIYLALLFALNLYRLKKDKHKKA